MTTQPLLGSMPRSVRRLLLFILLTWIPLGLECLRLWQRSPRFAVSGTSIIGILLEHDCHHRSSTEAVAGFRILGGDDPGAGPGQSTQRRSVQVRADNDQAVVVPDPPGEGHGQADEVRYLDLVHAGLWLRHKVIEALAGLDRYRIFAITCPYAGNKSGWPEQLARFAALPTEAAQHIVDEYVCLALNPRSGLFGPGKSLITRLRRDQVTEPITLAVARMNTMPWAIYRVRRLYYAPANAARSVDSVLLGGHRAVHTALAEVSRLVDISLTKNEEIAGAPARDGDRDTHRRLWLRRRGDGTYPTQEEFYTVAPAQAQDKELDSLADAWTDHTDEALTRLERRVDTAITVVQQALVEGEGRSAA